MHTGVLSLLKRTAPWWDVVQRAASFLDLLPAGDAGRTAIRDVLADLVGRELHALLSPESPLDLHAGFLSPSLFRLLLLAGAHFPHCPVIATRPFFPLLFYAESVAFHCLAVLRVCHHLPDALHLVLSHVQENFPRASSLAGIPDRLLQQGCPLDAMQAIVDDLGGAVLRRFSHFAWFAVSSPHMFSFSLCVRFCVFCCSPVWPPSRLPSFASSSPRVSSAFPLSALRRTLRACASS